ncbi:glycosyltransferase [Enterococcus sp. LJL99]
MNGIYLSQDLTHADGILEKINLQINEFEQNNYHITKHINGKRNKLHLARNLIPFFSEQYFKTKNIEWTNYDFAYIRKGAVLDKSVIELVKKAKKINPKLKIILEIPTYPYLNEFNGLVKIDIAMKEKRWTKKLSKYIDRIVTYSDDQEIFGVQCINISNAYEFKQLSFSREEAEDQTIHLIGVATLCFYHGYDRLIEGLKEYNQKTEQKTKVVFNLIGDGPVLSEYQKLVKDYNLENIVTLSGRKKLTELDQYYKEASIGIDSLGRHRSGVTYNSSLKGKEYLAKGLPIISGVKTDLDDKDIPFYYRVPNDDTPINIVSIVEWYQNLTNNKSRNQLSKEIYQYGETNFTFSVTFSPVIDYLNGIL